MSSSDLGDPRPPPNDAAVPVDSSGELRPAVARSIRTNSAGLIFGVPCLLGLLVFLWFSSHRTQSPKDQNAPPPNEASASVTPPPAPPPEVAAMETAARNPPPVAAPVSAPPALAVVTQPPRAPMLAATPTPSVAVANDALARRKAPMLVVDFGADGEGAGAARAGTPVVAGAAAAAGRPGSALTGDEQFAARVDAAEPERSRAVMLRDKANTVPQGAMIPAVLETALNSDLPGFTRAVVSRDVRSFDGSTVLIPRGSRVIGQYKSAALQGQSRAFVIWTRVLRPDGASIQIGSSGADPLGRAGMAGQVDRHFFERFSGAILLSVVNAGATALAGSSSTQIVIGSSQDASALASTASLLVPGNIAPTIKVAQGSPIRIFVARDLDFSPVGGVQP